MKYISKSPTFFEYRVKISNIIKSQFKTSRFSERIEGEKFEWRCSVKILDLSFHAVYFSSVTTSANAKAVLRSLAFPRKARVLHTARRSHDLRPRTLHENVTQSRDFPLSSLPRFFSFLQLLYLFHNRSTGMTRNSGSA